MKGLGSLFDTVLLIFVAIAARKQGIKVEGAGTYARWATGAHCGGITH